MTTLFCRIQPAHKFRITPTQIAKLLRIPKSLIVKVESWLYVLFVHRLDRGGQFISYRQLLQWKNAVACQIQQCSTSEQLEQLWDAIILDRTKHNQQYDTSVLPFLEKIWTKCQEAIPKLVQKSEGNAIAPYKENALAKHTALAYRSLIYRNPLGQGYHYSQ